MSRHRLNSTASIPAVDLLPSDGSSSGYRGGQHRVAKSSAVSATTVAGAAVALAGAIGLAAGGAAQAATPSTPTTGHKAPVLPTMPALADLPNVADLAADLSKQVNLPADIDKAMRDLLPKKLPVPEQHKHTAVRPVHGTVTSGYGARWGVVHYGVDIANKIGTPIYAVTDGTVIESGPASGFGQWVRVRQDDGTIGVFGHVDQSFVKAGQKVKAGDQIATVGNRGNSTGPHLHYEVWDKNGNKINPQVWLKKRGVDVD
ncbi:peptidoglycan DD-metalloendopeptidase family protein [Gordonia amarae]|uniref:M23ase beta-sheet core domain-containing protein n=2 Tax=Gordonia amarae TaxID=36821 RepID=G7GSP5_9ACTN|nr:M23 family metallopeptidase [Gordonia amarae]MCS3879465.1 murein DD-endopeptidase MepM/ murein hydrolase activator NlpD [Gordonia amarae]QHN17941.1 peptidoglycan DD-metalloendopeptidase family protein [Gordonia amarae]QHN22461.1 peptidoglycan DD-metalloendopeptidase family protein [Gordonia amarae]QHN31327.1 peptidoglycan DD-metalloendopeptidase family protein [Gordonia amarae]QHN40072.1 peptidoglycan DD-metalloendopeptidase family protein [Gordonia amarae]